MSKQAIITLTVSILGALKIVLDASGYNMITNDVINTCVNFVSAIVTIAGIIHNHTEVAPIITESEVQAVQEHSLDQA